MRGRLWRANPYYPAVLAIGVGQRIKAESERPRGAPMTAHTEVDVKSSGGRAPGAQQRRLDVRGAERLFQQQVVDR